MTKLGDDLRQSGEDMDLESIFAPIPARTTAAIISRSVLTARGMKAEHNWYKGHETRLVFD